MDFAHASVRGKSDDPPVSQFALSPSGSHPKESDSFTVEDRYRIAVEDKLWGISSIDEPLREDVVEQTLKELFPDRGGNVGFTEGMAASRTKFSTSCFIKDEGFGGSCVFLLEVSDASSKGQVPAHVQVRFQVQGQVQVVP